ncbi:hypothetical protein HHL21_12205 [Massilia sp. RP-1-19]|uniref:Uncharacterized protein n=1 Tax=Massilia polaris TaxID=2728846 RepID=A0A848HR96_9BURK|nr:hypothetical protein [Massilia polaris]NML61823.1 hypothetical protein [Massilia polaris]
MTSTNADLIAAMREFALDPSGICYVVRGRRGAVAIFEDDIGRFESDEGLLEFIRARCAE